jgi:Tol biopolymer transport system component
MRCVPAVLFLGLIAGCGGGDDGGGGGTGGGEDDGVADDGDGGGGDDDGGGNDGELPSDVNGELRGLVFFDAPYDYVQLDLSSGVTTVVRNRAGDLSADASPSVDGQEFVTTDDALSGDFALTDLLLLDRDGSTVSGFEFEAELAQPELSPDGSRIALTVNAIPTVLDRDAQILAQFDQLEDPADLEWTPDGRLLVSIGDSIQAIDDALSSVELVAQFAGDEPGVLAVSPDGTQLAFDVLGAESGDQHVFMMNMDGSELRQVTTSDSDEDAPAWSPDGRWLFLRQEVTSFDCPVLWAVPPDATMIELGTDDAQGAFSVQQFEDGDLRNVCAFSPPKWRAELEPLPSSPGTPPDGAGPNAGLPGRLFFEGFAGTADDNDGFVELTLAEAAPRLLPLPPEINSTYASDPYVSRNGEEVVFRYYDVDKGVEEIQFKQLDGGITGEFAQPDEFTGQPRLSPDGSLVAIEWHSIEGGDEASVPVVTIFDRSGAIQGRFVQSQAWDWLPDGRLVLASLDAVMVTSATLDETTEIAVLPDEIDELAASPDGERLALTMNGHIWTVGIDGRGLRRMTTAEGAVFSPSWSPDGRYLAVRSERICPVVHVIPSDGERVSVGDPVVPTSSLELREIEDGRQLSVCAFSGLTWR